MTLLSKFNGSDEVKMRTKKFILKFITLVRPEMVSMDKKIRKI